MQELFFITCAIPVLLLIWNQGNINESEGNCESFSEIDGFNIKENVFDFYEMQEFEGGGDSSNFCRDGICTKNLLTNNDRFIDELSINDNLKFHDLSLRTNSSFKSTEKLLAHAVLKRCGHKGLFVTTTLLFSDRRTGNKTLLTAVRAETFQQKGYARVSRGGVFQDHVELQLRSEKGDGFQYEISVYGLD